MKIKHFLSKFTFVLVLFLLSFSLFGQNINYQVRISQLKANADNNDGGFLGTQDPTWYIWLMDNGTTGTSLTTWQASGCINTTNTFGTWWSGTPAMGPTIPFAWLNVLNTDATSILTEMEGHEEDCSNLCTYQASGPIFTSCWVNGDDNLDARAPSGNLSFLLDAPCTWNTYDIQNLDYFARLEVYWEYVSLDPGSISGNQFVCSGGDPVMLNNVIAGTAGTSSWLSYQWEQSVGCTGTFIDIAGAVNINYDPPLGFIQNTCYRRKTLYGCASVVSNEVTIGIEIPSSPPSSITSNPPSICGSGTVSLTVNGGSLGTNADWYWYNGDPNGTGVLIGQGSPLNNYALSSTSTIYARAQGNCDTTNTTSINIIVNTGSIVPTVLTASQTTICVGDITNLTASGGSLGTNASYAWYEVDPAFGNPVPVFSSTSSSYNSVTPLVTTTYYVRIEGCDTTATASQQVIVNQSSVAPSGVNSSVASVCSGSPVTLSIIGGTLGTGANWYWYEGGCGAGVPIGSSGTTTVNPTQTTTYFVRAEGTCNVTNCSSITILVDDLSTAPVTIIPTNSSVCPGGTTVLSVAGGSLGAGANWQWYNGACGGILVGSGPTITVNPAATTDYYVRAEGLCNTTACANLVITVDAISSAATGVTASSNNICPNTSVDLTVGGGALGAGASWEWYEGSCGGIYLGSGSMISISPSITSTYYARAEGTCNTTNCSSVTVMVNPISTSAISIVAANTSVCPGGNVLLSVNGGNLVTGDNWYWYESGCGAGMALGTGNSITVTPVAQTTYYVRAEGPCGVSSCASTTINMNLVSQDPVSIVASNTAICSGASVVLSVSGGALGTNASWQWYSGACGSALVGTGNSISVTPSATTTYFVRAEGSCGNTNCISITIVVGAGVPDPTSAQVIINNICPGQTSQIYVVGSPLPVGYSWVWYTGACGAVTVGVGDTITVSPTITETYYVRSVGLCGETNCQSVTVTVQDGSITPTSINASNNNFCQGESTTLSLNGGTLSAGAQWLWYQNSCGGVQIGTGISITLTPLNSGTYYVRSEGGICGNTNCESIYIGVIETIVHANPFDTICGFSTPFVLEGGSPMGGGYTGAGVSNGMFYPEIAGIGSHAITYTYTSPSNCTGSVDQNIVIIESNMTAGILIEEFPCSQGGVTLRVNVQNSQGFLSYYWSDGSYDDVISFAQEGAYFVTVKDATNCVVKSNEVEVTAQMECIEIPNTFTPNSDGKNDTWNLYFPGYNDASLIVFSRWGREVYKTAGLEIHWDGRTTTGATLPADVYYYVLELNGGDKSQSGTITLLK